MSAPILAIRPQPACDATVARGRALGLEIEACPLLEVQPLPWDPPPAEQIDALLLGSANAVRHAGQGLERYRGKPAYAVGAATAAAARKGGLEVAGVGRGGLQELLDTLRPPLTLLRLAGASNAAAQFEGYRPLSAEAALAAAPTAIVVTKGTVDAAGGKDALLRAPGLASTPAARAGSLLVVDDAAILGFGPSAIRSALDLAQRMRKLSAPAGSAAPAAKGSAR